MAVFWSGEGGSPAKDTIFYDLEDAQFYKRPYAGGTQAPRSCPQFP